MTSSIERVSLRQLLTLAWPIVLARATQSVVGFTDALMSAPLGEDTLAAVTTGSLNVLALGSLGVGTVFIVQSFAAQLQGRGDLEGLRRYAYYGLGVALLAAAAGLLLIPALPWLAHLLGFTPAVERQFDDYVVVRLLGLGAIIGVEAIGNWYGGLGNTRLSMLGGVVIMIANVFGNYALIEPRFGLPGYGAVGSAWASTLASYLGFFVLLFAFWRGYGAAELPRSGPLGLRRSEFLRVLRFGLPNGLNWFLEFGAFLLFINVVIGHLGTTVLAAMNVVMQINSISFMPAFGVASSGAILAGNAIGKKQLDEVWPIVRLTLLVSCVWMGLIGSLYWIAPSALIGLFRPRDLPAQALIAAGSTMLMFATFWQLFDAVGMTFSEALRSAGDTSFTMKARIALAWLVFTPAAWTAVLIFHGGIPTIMLCLIVYLAVLATTLALRFANGSWKSIDLLGEPLL